MRSTPWLSTPASPRGHRRAVALGLTAAVSATLLAGADTATAQPISGANLPNLAALPARAFAADHRRLKMQVAAWNTKTYDIDFLVPMRVSLLRADRRTVVRTRRVEVAPRSVFVKDRTLAQESRTPRGGSRQIAAGWGTRLNLNRHNGLALRLRGVRNGVYVVRTQLDPGHVLPEADTGDNVSFTRIRITGVGAGRSITVLRG